MYCSKCGANIPDSSLYCNSCGNNVENNNALDISFNKKNDFIIMNCPQCGGKLEIRNNSDNLTCIFCESDFLIRHNNNGVTLETFARCPTCNRNDKAVLAKLKFGFPNEPEAKLLPRDGLSCGSSILLLFGIVAILIGIGLGIYQPDILFGTISMIFFGAILLCIALIPRFIKNNNSEKSNTLSIRNNEEDKKNYSMNIKIWETIYYCERDDTFFTTGKGKTTISRDKIGRMFPYWSISDNNYL